MEVLLVLAAMAASRFAVDGRPMNISTSWFLPEEGFPVFYRYFEDKLTWNGALDACGSHHADLLSVQTVGQTDAARAYLKKIDVGDSIWIGLQRESPEEQFSWTNGDKLLGDGNWAELPPKSTEKLCVAVDPAGDFRWNAHYCGGPEVASFVCEMAVPEWAKKENGCLMSSLPSLTVTLIPEVGVIQLLSDCGLDGTRRIACNERASREEIIKHLSCNVDAFTGSTAGGGTRKTDINNRINPHDTTRSYHPLTRHRRSAPSTAPTTLQNPPQNPATLTPNKHLSHAFPHSPYLASERNAPSTPKPPRSAPPRITTPSPTSQPTPNNAALDYKPLPVLVITADASPPNDSLPSPGPDNPPIVLMIDNKSLRGPFLLPLLNDIIINDPSLSPLQIISVDLIDMVNLTTPVTPHEPPDPAPKTPLPSPGPLPPTTSKPDAGEAPLNAVEAESNKTDVSRKPKRGRASGQLYRSSYPRLLTRLLG